jgi:hypothetical protein
MPGNGLMEDKISLTDACSMYSLRRAQAEFRVYIISSAKPVPLDMFVGRWLL